MLKIKRNQEIPAEWREIIAGISSGTLDMILGVRDELTFTDKAGNERTAVVAKAGKTGALLILKDIVNEAPIKKHLDGKLLNWRDCDLRGRLNTEYLAALPDELAALITPRTITQVIGGETIVTEDKLWLPSTTELFGKGSRYTACDGPDEEQLPIFQTEGDRVKCLGGETWWYWLRSPLSSSTTGWCIVFSHGGANSYYATVAYGVAFGFKIGEI